MKIIISAFDHLKPLREVANRIIRQKAVKQIHSFKIRQNLEGPHILLKRGISLAPLEKIIGSVGRAHDFLNISKTDYPR